MVIQVQPLLSNTERNLKGKNGVDMGRGRVLTFHAYAFHSHSPKPITHAYRTASFPAFNPQSRAGLDASIQCFLNVTGIVTCRYVVCSSP